MAFQPVPGGCLIEINHTLKGEPAQNTLWFETKSPITQEAVTTLADAVATQWLADFVSIMSEDATYLNVEATAQDVDNGWTYTSVIGTGTDGGAATPAQSNNVTIAFSFRTGRAGRSSRGRNFWIGLPAVEVVNNRVDPVFLNLVVARYSGLIGPSAVAAGWEWCVCSRRHEGEQRPTGLLQPITAVVYTDDVVDSARRRLPGRGE